MTHRIQWVDMTKGFVMLLTVYSHCGLGLIPYIGKWVYSFYMPLFFFISGLLLDVNKYSLVTFLKRRWSTLYRPYFILSFILAILCLPVHYVEFTDFYKSLVINGWGGYALWFIPVLSIAELLVFSIHKGVNNRIIRVLISIICFLIGYVLYKLNVQNPYNWAFIPTAMGFYSLGNIFRDYQSYLRKEVSLIILLCSLGVSFLCFLYPEKPQWFINQLISLLAIPAAIGGTLFICLFMKCTENVCPKFIKSILTYIGRNTYLVLAFHQIILQLVRLSGLTSNGFVIRLIMWIVIVCIIESVNRFYPQILGK